MFVSHNGTIMAASDRHQAIGKHVSTIHSDWQQNFKFHNSSKPIYKSSEFKICVVTQLLVVNSQTPWYVHIHVPEEVFLAEAHQIHQKNH